MHWWVPGWPQLCAIVSSSLQINSKGFALNNCLFLEGFGPHFPYLKQMHNSPGNQSHWAPREGTGEQWLGTKHLLIDLEGTWIILFKSIVWIGHRIASAAGHPGCLVWLYAVNRKKWVLMNDWHRWRFSVFIELVTWIIAFDIYKLQVMALD